MVDIYSIKKYSNCPIGLQRLATGVEERPFANVRKYMNNSINEKLFIEILVHKIMTNEINEELDLHGNTNYHDEGGVNISNEMIEHFEIPENNLKEEIFLLIRSARDKNFQIISSNFQYLIILMINLSMDPNAKVLIPHSESPTTGKQVPMRWNISMNHD